MASGDSVGGRTCLKDVSHYLVLINVVCYSLSSITDQRNIDVLLLAGCPG